MDVRQSLGVSWLLINIAIVIRFCLVRPKNRRGWILFVLTSLTLALSLVVFLGNVDDSVIAMAGQLWAFKIVGSILALLAAFQCIALTAKPTEWHGLPVAVAGILAGLLLADDRAGWPIPIMLTTLVVALVVERVINRLVSPDIPDATESIRETDEGDRS